MNAFVNAAEQLPDSVTENGAETFASSLSSHLDLFFQVGASRGKAAEVTNLFKSALKQDEALAVRIALWARDARGGAGEREIFREMIKCMSEAVQLKLFAKVVELGRWDDLEVLIDSGSAPVQVQAANFWKEAVLAGHGLAAKWAPRKGKLVPKMRGLWAMSPKQYRKTIVTATNVVEQKMCAKDWDNIEFAHVPSVAAARYNKAFLKNAAEKYAEYKAALVKGETKINASALFPHDVVRGRTQAVDHDVMNEQWKALPNFLGEKTSDILVMSDVSGSMSCAVSGSVTAMDVSIALGLYISERQVGAFKDLVLTFSGNPKFHKVQGAGIVERIANLAKADWGMSTDINKAFRLIVDTGVANKVPAAEMPKILLILSDMEFDYCGKGTNFQAAQALYKEAGYEMPKVVFWNLNSRTKNVPVRAGENGVALVSGFSPAILKSILAAEDFTPEKIMLDAVMSDRYAVAGVTA